MVRILAVIGTLLGAGSVAAAFTVDGIYWPLVLIILFIIFWFITFTRSGRWFNNPGLFLVFSLIGYGFIMSIPAIPLFAGGFLALAGWDLTDFYTRLQMANPEDDQGSLQRRHLLRLGPVLVIGLVLVLVAVNIHLIIPFSWMVLGSLAVALGLGKLISAVLKIE
jgi:hypothetical protein